MFKYYTNSYLGSCSMINIGIINDKWKPSDIKNNYDVNNNCNKEIDYYSNEGANRGIGMSNYDFNSFSWATSGNSSKFYYRNVKGTHNINWHRFSNEFYPKDNINDINSYILFQINLITNKIKLISQAFEIYHPNGKNYQEYDIPKELLRNTKKIRVGVSISFDTTCKIPSKDMDACLGLGIVRVNL